MGTHTIITKCQISNSKKLKKIINLGFLPPVNQLLKINSKNPKQNFFETELLYSPICSVSLGPWVEMIVLI